MTTDTREQTKDAQVAPETAPAQPELLDQLVQAVRQDSRLDARNYLEETATPHGGE